MGSLICFSRAWLESLCGLVDFVYIAIYDLCMPSNGARNSDTKSKKTDIHMTLTLEALCVPSRGTACLPRQLRRRRHHSIDSTFCETMPLAIPRNTCMHYTAHPTSVLVHTGELVLLCGVRDRGEDGADVCLYATAHLYQTCRVRAADPPCDDRRPARPDVLRERRRPRQSCI